MGVITMSGPVHGLLLLLLVPALVHCQCREGWQVVGDTCYLLSDNTTNWFDAKQVYSSLRFCVILSYPSYPKIWRWGWMGWLDAASKTKRQGRIDYYLTNIDAQRKVCLIPPTMGVGMGIGAREIGMDTV